MTGRHHLDFDDDDVDGRQLLLDDVECGASVPAGGANAVRGANAEREESKDAEPIIGGRQALEADLERGLD